MYGYNFNFLFHRLEGKKYWNCEFEFDAVIVAIGRDAVHDCCYAMLHLLLGL